MTIRGLVSLGSQLLANSEMKYIMFRNFQSGRLEGEFGVFRQLNDGNYYMSAGNVCNALRLQRIKLFTKIDVMDHVWHAESNCCTKPLSDEELEALNDCFFVNE